MEKLAGDDNFVTPPWFKCAGTRRRRAARGKKKGTEQKSQ
jgi:hypothetical protein